MIKNITSIEKHLAIVLQFRLEINNAMFDKNYD